MSRWLAKVAVKGMCPHESLGELGNQAGCQQVHRACLGHAGTETLPDRSCPLLCLNSLGGSDPQH